MRISIRHDLRFAITPGTAHAVQHLLLTPIATPAQSILEWDILIPGIETAARFTDAYGNSAISVSQRRPEAETLFVSVFGTVETRDTGGVIGTLPDDPIPALFKRPTPQTKASNSLVKKTRDQVRGGGTVEALRWLMTTLHEAQAPAMSAPADEDGHPAIEIVAEDHAHVFVATARGLDLPARLVTGYVLGAATRPDRLHAWAEVFIDEDTGWMGFDPSANLCPNDAYVRLAAGLDAESAAPFRGVPAYLPDGPESLQVTELFADAAQSQDGNGQSQMQG